MNRANFIIGMLVVSDQPLRLAPIRSHPAILANLANSIGDSGNGGWEHLKGLV